MSAVAQVLELAIRSECQRMDVSPGSQEEHELCDMNSATTNGASGGRCSRTSHVAFPEFDDRRILNGIFWVLRSGAPWRDLPESFGPHTTCYNRFVRWRRAGVWDRIMDAVAAAHDAAVQMIDTSVVRVHQP